MAPWETRRGSARGGPPGPLLEAGHVCASGTDPAGEWLPPLVERGVLHPDDEGRLLEALQLPGGLEQFGQVTLAHAREPRLVAGQRIEVPGRFPEDAQRAMVGRMVPDAGSDDAARSRDASHLAEADDRVPHEVDDELRERRVELVVSERDALRGRDPDVHSRVSQTDCADERLGGVDGGHPSRTYPPDQLADEGAGSAADIEHPHRRTDHGEVGELSGQASRVPSHEGVVGLPDHLEHPGTIRALRSHWGHPVPLVLEGEPLPVRPGLLCASSNTRKGLSQRPRCTGCQTGSVRPWRRRCCPWRPDFMTVPRSRPG